MGYHIPAGAIVIANNWYGTTLAKDPLYLTFNESTRGILHDPKFYPQPDKLMPERFLTPNFMDPRTFAFGYGRR
jgi:hypothetical protein